MFKKLTMIGLFAISLVTILGTEVLAQCRGGGGSCFLFPKGLGCNISGVATGPGDKSLSCGGEGVCPSPFVTDPDTGECVGGVGATRDPVTLVLSCQNAGGNFAIGRNPEEISASQTGQTPLSPQDLDKNGRFKNKTVVALPTQATLNDLTPFCPTSSQWTAFDIAFCGNRPFEANFEVLSDGQTRSEVRAVCNGPSEPYPCSQVSFVKQLGTFSGPNYTCRVCPKTSDGFFNCAACLTPGSCNLLQ